MMDRLIIEGGLPLSGEVTPSGNKNAALPLIAAALLTKERVVLRNVPRIRDVEAMVALVEALGVDVEWLGRNEVSIEARTVETTFVDESLASRIRASFLLAGPLLARFGEAHMPPPGGDVIGRRRLDPHLDAFRALGAEVTPQQHLVDLWAPAGLQAGEIFLDEASVMATENALMAAAITPGATTIRHAACEPHVQDLCRLLVEMGCEIDGIASNLLTVRGVDRLVGADHTVSPDHIEIASFMALAAVTRGEIVIRDTDPRPLRGIRGTFACLGLRSEVRGRDIVVPAEQRLEVRNDLGGAIPKIDSGPWPSFPADLTSIALAVATQAEGVVLIHEKMFENRLFFVDKLISMGARIVLCDPHRAVVHGPSWLHGNRMMSPDIRAGMALLIAGLGADGVSEIDNAEQIDRGYERIDERLRELGARIERVKVVPEAVAD